MRSYLCMSKKSCTFARNLVLTIRLLLGDYWVIIELLLGY